MTDSGPAERDDLLAQVRELSGFVPAVPPAPTSAPDLTTGPARLSALELRRFMPQLERLGVFKAEQGRLPGAGPSASAGERSLGAWLWRQRRAREAGSLHPHAAELLEEALGPYWPLPPRQAQTLEQHHP
ncbi:hypothetical protein J2W21_003563 [Sinomonas atrocyanea]|uniref:hypothetical protein n=1 Tax=Sinomonas atrocyanea TaxID=37927 RepID=UPI00277D38E6|nr:hypothetical protein [Sinomonas atrocyanea]MDP9886038.1 hypothetical protein [Sinomonas atrocyanea]